MWPAMYASASSNASPTSGPVIMVPRPVRTATVFSRAVSIGDPDHVDEGHAHEQRQAGRTRHTRHPRVSESARKRSHPEIGEYHDGHGQQIRRIHASALYVQNHTAEAREPVRR